MLQGSRNDVEEITKVIHIELHKRFIKNFAYLIKQNGMTKASFARLIGVSKGVFNEQMNGHRLIHSFTKYLLIAAYLEKSLEEMFFQDLTTNKKNE